MIIETLHNVIDKLNSIEVPYMLSGSVAMSFYTVSRSTRDIDLVVILKAEQIDKMAEVFAGDYFDKESAMVEIKRNGMFNIIINANGFKVDFILVKNNRYSENEFERRKLIYDYGRPIYVVSPEDLVIAKLKWIQELFSERQYTDIENIIMGNKLDEEYIKYWVNELKLKTFGLL